MQVISAIKDILHYPSKIRIIKNKVNFYVDVTVHRLILVIPIIHNFILTGDKSHRVTVPVLPSTQKYIGQLLKTNKLTSTKEL